MAIKSSKTEYSICGLDILHLRQFRGKTCLRSAVRSVCLIVPVHKQPFPKICGREADQVGSHFYIVWILFLPNV